MSWPMIESQRPFAPLHNFYLPFSPFSVSILVITFHPRHIAFVKFLHSRGRPKSNQTNLPLMDLIHKSEVRVISSQLITFATQIPTGRQRTSRRKPTKRNRSRAKAENCQNQEDEAFRGKMSSLVESCLYQKIRRT